MKINFKLNYYKILGISMYATNEEIKKAYREMSKKHHPDVGGDPDVFKRMQEAYDFLTSEDNKYVYDFVIRNKDVISFLSRIIKDRNYVVDIIDYSDVFRVEIENEINSIDNRLKSLTKRLNTLNNIFNRFKFEDDSAEMLLSSTIEKLKTEVDESGYDIQRLTERRNQFTQALELLKHVKYMR